MERIDFVQKVAGILEVEPKVRFFGVSPILVSKCRARPFQVGTNGSSYWIETDLDAFFPGCGAILWAHGSYLRASLVSDGAKFPTTHDPEFDATYIVMGRVMEHLSKAVRSVLLNYRDLRPRVQGIRAFCCDVPDGSPVHVHASPPLTDSMLDPPYIVRAGEQKFTPEHCARNVYRVTELAERLERADRP